MRATQYGRDVAATADQPDWDLIDRLKRHFKAAFEVHRGVCLLSAGKYDQATVAFSRASVHGSTDKSLASYMAACHVGRDDAEAASRQLARSLDVEDPDETAYIRSALAAAAAGAPDEAVLIMREAVSMFPESAEVHFQLGTVLVDLEECEEAELRFTQSVNIERNHSEALVSLAMCCGLRKSPEEALPHLQRAQARRPRDARIGLLLAQAAKAVHQRGNPISTHAVMPGEDCIDDREGIDELGRVIEEDPDFVDSFLSIPPGEVDRKVFAILLTTLEAALERQPEHAELHFHCGQVLARLGRQEEAIDAGERAVGIDPRNTRALIVLGKLYQQTDRNTDAAQRLEEAVAAGAEYADVFYLLGNLYRDRGQIRRARKAYERALGINGKYQEAQEALAALPA